MTERTGNRGLRYPESLGELPRRRHPNDALASGAFAFHLRCYKRRFGWIWRDGNRNAISVQHSVYSRRFNVCLYGRYLIAYECIL